MNSPSQTSIVFDTSKSGINLHEVSNSELKVSPKSKNPFRTTLRDPKSPGNYTVAANAEKKLIRDMSNFHKTTSRMSPLAKF